MSDYIKREDVLEICEWYQQEYTECAYALDNLTNEMRRLHPVDAVEVVRCRDCKYYNTAHIRGSDGEVHEVKHCNRFGLAYQPNDYCSYGERRLTSYAISAGSGTYTCKNTQGGGK